jgi:hypothetical protein
MATPLVNGRAYDFTQITATILDVPMASATAITYTETQDVQYNKGAGDRPVSVGVGSIEAEASITLSMNDVEALRSVALDGSLLKIPFFDIVVVFGNAQNPQRHILKNVRFKDDGVEASEGDTDLRRSFSLGLSHVVYR